MLLSGTKRGRSFTKRSTEICAELDMTHSNAIKMALFFACNEGAGKKFADEVDELDMHTDVRTEVNVAEDAVGVVLAAFGSVDNAAIVG